MISGLKPAETEMCVEVRSCSGSIDNQVERFSCCKTIKGERQISSHLGSSNGWAIALGESQTALPNLDLSIVEPLHWGESKSSPKSGSLNSWAIDLERESKVSLESGLFITTFQTNFTFFDNFIEMSFRTKLLLFY